MMAKLSFNILIKWLGCSLFREPSDTGDGLWFGPVKAAVHVQRFKAIIANHGTVVRLRMTALNERVRESILCAMWPQQDADYP
jgi:hypothetical protein